MSQSHASIGPCCVPRRGVFRILVCRPNHRLGNTLLLTPLIAELELTYRGAEIDLLCEGPLAHDVFSNFFSVKNVFCLPLRGFKHPIAFLSLLHRLRATYYDLIIDPSVSSNFSRTLTRILRGCYKLGFNGRRGAAGLTQPVPLSAAGRHMAHQPINLVRWLRDDSAREGTFASLDIRLSEDEVAQGKLAIERLLGVGHQDRKGPTVGLFADATGAKCYPRAWWGEFITAFEAMSPASTLIELVPVHGRSMVGARLPAYYSSDIRRMGAVMAATQYMISADSGVMHLAVASRVPTLGLFKVTDLDAYAPYGVGCSALNTGDLTACQTARLAASTLEAALVLSSSPTAMAAWVATRPRQGAGFGPSRPDA